MDNCLEDISLGNQKKAEKLAKIINNYFDNPIVKAMTGGSMGDFRKLYNDILPSYDFNYSNMPSSRELRKLDKHVNKYLSNMSKIPNPLERFIKLPQVLMDKFPTTKKYQHELGRADDYNRANRRDIESDLNEITRLTNIASGQTGLLKTGFSRSKAQKEYNNLINKYKKVREKEGVTAGEKFWTEEIATLHKNGSIRTLQLLHDLMINDWKGAKQTAKGSIIYSPPLIEAATIWHEGSKGGKPLKERLWKILGNGLKDTIDMIERSNNMYAIKDSPYSKNVLRAKELKQLYEDYFSKNAPKKPKNYFPRQIIDIAPTMAQLSNDIWSKKVHNQPEVVSKYIERMIENVTDNLKVPANVFERSANTSTKQSQDVIGILDHYAKNAIRFNHTARISKLTNEGLREMFKLQGEKFERHGKFWSDYIVETHQAALGINFRDSKLSTISRAITSFEFISKLGFNLRGAFKNSTQSLQHWVWWGNKGLKRAYFAGNSADKKIIIDNEMKQLGYEFVNIQELAQPKELMNSLKIDQTGAVMEKTPGIGMKITDMLENVARISGKPMQYVENKFNRGVAFKIAFLDRYETMLTNDSALRRALANTKSEAYKNASKQAKGRTFYDKNGNIINKQYSELTVGERARNEMIRVSSNYATDMVKKIHYLYDPYQKPVAIRGPVGSILGQFSTYSINFFNYQQKIAANAVNSGEWLSPESKRLYRLGSFYAFVTGLSAITNTALTNVIENDTWERLKQFNMYYSGDSELKDRAFFGKGPLIGTVGGPFVSDVMTLGNIMGFLDMDSNDFQMYKTGYKSYAERADSDPARELVRMLNTSMERQLYTNLPRVINGTSLPTVIGQELGLYGTPELKPLKKTLMTPLQKTPFPRVNDYFTPDIKGETGRGKYKEALRKRNKSKKVKTYSDKASNSTYSSAELDILLKTLQSMT